MNVIYDNRLRDKSARGILLLSLYLSLVRLKRTFIVY